MREAVADQRSNGSGWAFPQEGGTPSTILLVEDDADVRKVIRQMLEAQGYRVLEADGAPEALHLAENFPDQIDLVITDVVMPRSNCNRFVCRLRVGRPGLKVIYISGHAEDIVRGHGVKCSSRDFIQKPFTSAHLTRRVREALGVPMAPLRA